MKLVNGIAVDGAGIPHHIWCNYFMDGETTPCKMCGSLKERYPEIPGDKHGDALMMEHFPGNLREGNG